MTSMLGGFEPVGRQEPGYRNVNHLEVNPGTEIRV